MLQRNFEQPADALEEHTAGALERGSQPTVDLRELARILRRRWKMVAAPPLALMTLALLYALSATTLYTATSTVLVDPRRSSAIESNQSALQMSNFGTDDATIESETLLIQSGAILQRVVEKLKLTADPEFIPTPGLLDPVKRLFSLFSSGGPAGGASLDDAAKARSVDILQRRMKVNRQGSTFLVDINVSSESPRKAAAIANAVLAYEKFEHYFRGPEFAAPAQAGAHVQRPLWASTGTKDPQASDVLYVKALAAPLTVNTMPEGTLKALADHGDLGAILPADGGDCEEVLAQFAKAGVDVEALATQLQDEGAKAFVKSWHELMEVIVSKSADLGKAG